MHRMVLLFKINFRENPTQIFFLQFGNQFFFLNQDLYFPIKGFPYYFVIFQYKNSFEKFLINSVLNIFVVVDMIIFSYFGISLSGLE